jgi:hypothetical protein
MGRGPLHVESGRLTELKRLAAYADHLADAENGNWFEKLERLSRHGWGGLCPVLGNRLLSVWGTPKYLDVPEVEKESKEEIFNETEEVKIEAGGLVDGGIVA